MRVVCLQHVPFEGPGAFAPHLASRGIAVESHLVPAVGVPTDPGDLLLIMGGPMSVNDPEPWLADELRFVRRTLDAGRPVLGICLGSQLMAKALGATVRGGRALELGMTPITLTDAGKADPVFGTLPTTAEVFEWHGEIFDLPPDAVPLAGSAVAPLQAFRYGTAAYGLLFHLEMDDPGMASLCRECAPDLTRAGISADSLIARARPELPRLHRWGAALLDHLLPPSR
ncbi:MAG: type 1 glutamine amidotransferase [Nitrospiraceae bacterium]